MTIVKLTDVEHFGQRWLFKCTISIKIDRLILLYRAGNICLIAAKLSLLTWESMGIYSIFHPTPSGP